jgi:hypothetical protein
VRVVANANDVGGWEGGDGCGEDDDDDDGVREMKL